MTLLTPYIYWPPIGFWHYALQVSSICWEVQENFLKSTYRNRCEVLATNGKQVLSVPIVGGKDTHQSIQSTQIAYADNWTLQHWRTLVAAYNRSPFFEYYADEIWDTIYKPKYTHLIELNKAIFDYCITVLKIGGVNVCETEQFVLDTNDESIVDIRQVLRPSKWQKTTQAMEVPSYIKVFETGQEIEYISSLSILDVLFNLGPESGAFLQSIKNK